LFAKDQHAILKSATKAIKYRMRKQHMNLVPQPSVAPLSLSFFDKSEVNILRRQRQAKAYK
jgi:hypothetical protein